MGYNCSHEQFLQWTKNESGGAGGGSVYDVCWHSVDFPLDCHSMRTKKVTLLIIPRASFCYLTHSPSCRYPLSIDFPSSVVNLSESCPIHLWQWLCLWYKQSIWLSQTVWNLAAFFFFSISLRGRSVVCISHSIAKKTLTPQNGNMKGKMAPLLGQEMCKWGFILTMANPFTMAIHISMLRLLQIPWATS